jgi:hypothetical protein
LHPYVYSTEPVGQLVCGKPVEKGEVYIQLARVAYRFWYRIMLPQRYTIERKKATPLA